MNIIRGVSLAVLLSVALAGAQPLTLQRDLGEGAPMRLRSSDQDSGSLVVAFRTENTAAPASADSTGSPQVSGSPAARPVAEQPNLALGVSERLRIESWDNSTSLSSAANQGSSYTRNRLSVAARWSPVAEFEGGVKLTNEFRYYFAPTTKEFTINEFFVDQLYAAWSFHAPLDGKLTVGRQNIAFGDGFVVFDGTPLDGSRSVYFNAARCDVQVSTRHRLSLFYTFVPMTDRGLPIYNDKSQILVEQPEEGFGLYSTSDWGALNLQLYGIIKNVKSEDPKTISSQINTTGARVKFPLMGMTTLAAEGGYQWGFAGDERRKALGGILAVEAMTGWNHAMLPQSFTVRGLYLSGDKSGTSRVEGWDPVFGRWPQWSESVVYTYTKEAGLAYWTNIMSVNLGTKVPVAQDADLLLNYWYMLAPEKAKPGAFPGGLGNIRGTLVTGRLTYKLSPTVSGHVVWERFAPGNYYFAGANVSNWARVEFMLTY